MVLFFFQTWSAINNKCVLTFEKGGHPSFFVCLSRSTYVSKLRSGGEGGLIAGYLCQSVSASLSVCLTDCRSFCLYLVTFSSVCLALLSGISVCLSVCTICLSTVVYCLSCLTGYSVCLPSLSLLFFLFLEIATSE